MSAGLGGRFFPNFSPLLRNAQLEFIPLQSALFPLAFTFCLKNELDYDD